MQTFILAAALAAVPSLVSASLIESRDIALKTTCSKPNTPFNYVGCYVDPSSPRALNYDTRLPRENMTIELCTATCRDAGYRYAGLEYYFQCFCGASVVGPGLATDQTQCNYACTGNSSQVCGGFDYVSVYEDPNFEPVDDTTIVDYSYQGCYSDNDSTGRALVYRQDQVDVSTATTEICLQACKRGGYSHAGLEYYGECYCGVVLSNNSLPTTDDSACNTPCNGNQNQMCGGPGAISLYIAADLEAAPPCPPDVPSTTITIIPSTSSTPVSSTSKTSTATITSTSTSATVTSTSATSATSTSTKSTAVPSTSSTSSKSSTLSTSTTSTKTSTTSSTRCTSTAPAPTCEYSLGSWCAKPIPYWSGGNWGAAQAFCKLQVVSCFLNAGYPAALSCWDFASWCSKIPSYSDKNKFLGACPPKNPPPTTTGVCTPTVTTPTATTSSVVPPTATGVCVLPSGRPGSGYENGGCVGNIRPPFVTCNDIYSDWRQNPFKLYSDKQSSNCPSYDRNHVPDACQAACKVQYKTCVNTYAQGCRNSNSGPSYDSAAAQCKNQYNDCIAANNNIGPGRRCQSWNQGWY